MNKSVIAFATLQADVRTFMDACNTKPATLNMFKVHKMEHLSPEVKEAFNNLMLGKALIYEEVVRELLVTLNKITNSYLNGESAYVLDDQLDEIADGCIDSIYVLLWLLNAMGYDGAPYWKEVQAANMRKIDPYTGKVLRREDGKILKPKDWVGPNTLAITQKQIEEALALNSAHNPQSNNLISPKEKLQIEISTGLEKLKAYTSNNDNIATALKNMDKKALINMLDAIEKIQSQMKEALLDAINAALMKEDQP